MFEVKQIDDTGFHVRIDGEEAALFFENGGEGTRAEIFHRALIDLYNTYKLWAELAPKPDNDELPF
jgi:hypothetical protein